MLPARHIIIPGIPRNLKVNNLHWRFSPGQAKQATHTRRDAKDEREKPDKVENTLGDTDDSSSS